MSTKVGASTWKRQARANNGNTYDKLTSNKRKMEKLGTKGEDDDLDKSGKKTRNANTGNQYEKAMKTGVHSRSP